MRKIIIILIFHFLPMFIYCQTLFEVNLLITDTIIVIKKSKKEHKYAIKVNAEINIPNLQDTLFFYNFNRYVPSSFFLSDRYKETSVGLIFIIEDKNHQIISPRFTHNSYANEKDETRINNSRIFVSSKQKIKYKQLNKEEQHSYDKAKYVISSEKQSLGLYPIFYYRSGTFNIYHNLPKGEYYLYFAYSNYYIPPSNICDGDKLFKGYFVSNKVKLIVE